MNRERPATPIAQLDTWAIAFALVFPTLLTLVYFTLLAEAPTIVQHVAYASLKIIQFAFPVYWYVKVQRRPLQLHGPRPQGILTGTAFGVLVLAAMWALYRYGLAPAGLMDAAAEPIRAKVQGFGVDTLPTYAALSVFYSLAHSLLEEYYWRWFVFGQLRRRVSLSTAIAISSLGFTAHHVLLLGTFFGWTSPLTWIFTVAIAVGGAIWAWLYHRSESLYPVWIGHLLVDAGIFLIGYHMLGNFLG